MSNRRNIIGSILLILLKCIVVGYSNGNESFPGRLFSNYGPLNMLLHFLRYLIYSVFHEKLSLFSSNFKNQFQDVVYYRPLGCLTLWYKGKKLKNVSIFGAAFSEIKNADILKFSWIKYFGSDFSFLIT